MRNVLILTAAGALTLLAGCTHPAHMAPSFGDSVEAMHRAQTIEAAPTQEPPTGSGATGASAQSRYQSGTTKPLMSSATSSTANSSR